MTREQAVRYARAYNSKLTGPMKRKDELLVYLFFGGLISIGLLAMQKVVFGTVTSCITIVFVLTAFLTGKMDIIKKKALAAVNFTLLILLCLYGLVYLMLSDPKASGDELDLLWLTGITVVLMVGCFLGKLMYIARSAEEKNRTSQKTIRRYMQRPDLSEARSD